MKHEFGSRVKFENKAQRDAVIALLKTVGMKWPWGPKQPNEIKDAGNYLSLYITTSLEIHGGEHAGGTNDVIGWTKDMYDHLVERGKIITIRVGEYDAEITKGQIKVGCQTIPNSVVREVASKLID